MANDKKNNSFFSVAFDLISTDNQLPYDLYVNASSVKSREKFVRIYPRDEALTLPDLEEFKRKYHQLYVEENQRNDYLGSLVKMDGVEDVEKAEVIKDTAISHLENIFERDLSTEVLAESIDKCKETVESMVEVIEDYSINQIQDLIGGLSFHDFYTYDHSINVSMYCIAILKRVNPKASKQLLTLIGLGGLLHDIGKIKVSTSILNSTSKLTDEQFAEIKKHPGDGNEIITEQLKEYPNKGEMDIVRRIAYEHHENVDGTGYPNKLNSDQIHPLAKICAIADFFDAVTTKRSYSEVVSIDEAISIMERTVGKKLDPTIFGIFAEDVTKIYGKKPATRELPDDFEPSVPHGSLPFQKLSAQKLDYNILGDEKDKKSYGSVKKA